MTTSPIAVDSPRLEFVWALGRVWCPTASTDVGPARVATRGDEGEAFGMVAPAARGRVLAGLQLGRLVWEGGVHLELFAARPRRIDQGVDCADSLGVDPATGWISGRRRQQATTRVRRLCAERTVLSTVSAMLASSISSPWECSAESLPTNSSANE